MKHRLGKGEVERSIRSGSTRNSILTEGFNCFAYSDPAVSGRTLREQDNSDCGESGEKSHFVLEQNRCQVCGKRRPLRPSAKDSEVMVCEECYARDWG